MFYVTSINPIDNQFFQSLLINAKWSMSRTIDAPLHYLELHHHSSSAFASSLHSCRTQNLSYLDVTLTILYTYIQKRKKQIAIILLSSSSSSYFSKLNKIDVRSSSLIKSIFSNRPPPLSSPKGSNPLIPSYYAKSISSFESISSLRNDH